MYRCFGCDRTTSDASLVTINYTDGRLRCADCVAYEASLRATAAHSV